MVLNLIVSSFAALIGSAIIPGVSIVTVGTAIIFSIALGLINITVGNLMRFFGCLLNIITLGLFEWVINAAVILIAGKMVRGVTIDGWLPAIFLALLMSFVSAALNSRYMVQ